MMARFAQHRPGKEENQETVEEGKTSLSPAQTSLAQVDLTRIFPYDKKLRWASVRGAFCCRGRMQTIESAAVPNSANCFELH